MNRIQGWRLAILVGISNVAGLAPAHDIAKWPAESHDRAEKLFAGGPGSIAHQDDWSGAHWNPGTRTLWLCRDTGQVRAYRLTGTGWRFDKRWNLNGVDCEGVTQWGGAPRRVLILAETQQQIREYDLSTASAVRLRTWDISGLVADDDGMEGMAFVPDAALAGGFVAGDGRPYPESGSDLGGLVFVSYQETGDLYALDLEVGGAVHLVGVYTGGLTNTRGLEFDPSTGILYAIDGSRFAAMRLSSKRAFDIELATESPGPSGVEGLALTPFGDAVHWGLVTDDDNDAGDGAVLLFNDFAPLRPSSP